MATHTKAIGTHEAIHPNWETVKGWAKATFAKERINEAAFCAVIVSLIGVVLSLYRAVEHYIIWDF